MVVEAVMHGVIEQEGTAMAAVPSLFSSTGNKETSKDNEA
jgi:hypothetical protein